MSVWFTKQHRTSRHSIQGPCYSQDHLQAAMLIPTCRSIYIYQCNNLIRIHQIQCIQQLLSGKPASVQVKTHDTRLNHLNDVQSYNNNANKSDLNAHLTKT